MSPQLRLICAQGRDYIYIKIAGTSALAMHRYHIHLVRSLLDEAHQGTLIPLQYTEVLHLYRWYARTSTFRALFNVGQNKKPTNGSKHETNG